LLRAEKYAVIRTCKLEEIKLPLENDLTLDDFPLEDFEVVFIIYVACKCRRRWNAS
jgi:hypothetical protein